MSKDLLNILSNSNKDIDNQQLMDYLAGKLSAADAHEVEKLMAENDFMNDAMEGLGTIENKKDINVYVEQINRDLKNKVEKKLLRREKRKLKEYPWVYLAIITVLALLLLVYYVLSKYYQVV
jgi:hypothetical protein